MKSFSLFAISCDKRDIEDPESISISICILTTLPTMFAAYALVVATMIVLLELTDMGEACCPLQMPLCCFPASILLQCGLVFHM